MYFITLFPNLWFGIWVGGIHFIGSVFSDYQACGKFSIYVGKPSHAVLYVGYNSSPGNEFCHIFVVCSIQ
jgi:hypothetical protein